MVIRKPRYNGATSEIFKVGGLSTMTLQRLWKLLLFAPSLLFIVVIALPALSDAQQGRPDGDVDQNGTVTATDALLAFQQALSEEDLSLPSHHGLAAGRFTVQPGAADERGNVVVSCPPGGGACVINVAADGSATYDGTGGVPTVMLATPEEFPALPPQRAAQAAQAPIVDLDGSLHVGSDVAPSTDQLTAAGTHDGMAVSYGRVRDGVGADELIAYLNQRLDLGDEPPGFQTFAGQPIVHLTEAASDELANDTLRAIQLINAALPRDSRLLFRSDPAPPRTPLEIPWGDIPEGQIFVDFSSPENPGHPAGTAYSQTQAARRIRSYVLINPADTVDALELQTHSTQERREQSESQLNEELQRNRAEYEDYLEEQDFSEEFEAQLRERNEEQLAEWYESNLERFRAFYDNELERITARYKNVTLDVLVHELVHAIRHERPFRPGPIPQLGHARRTQRRHPTTRPFSG